MLGSVTTERIHPAPAAGISMSWLICAKTKSLTIIIVVVIIVIVIVRIRIKATHSNINHHTKDSWHRGRALVLMILRSNNNNLDFWIHKHYSHYMTPGRTLYTE